MKTLNKTLSLVLVLVMVLGLFGVASAADFKDKAEIENVEAVNTMAALNIINGKNGNVFDPTGTVTRAEMSKMICVALNGGKEPVLGTTANPTYSDIQGHWAAGYIEYCSTLGIVAGMGDGTFAPDATVTGSQAAKMMLVAMNYKADVFGFTGPAWETRVNVEANKAGLYADLGGLNASEALSRDNAAQLIYNGIFGGMMELSWQQNANGEITQTYKLNTNKNIAKEKFDLETAFAKLEDVSYDSVDKDYDTTFTGALVNNTADGRFNNAVACDVDYSDYFMMNVKVLFSEDVNGNIKVYGVYPNKSSVVLAGVVGQLSEATINTSDIVLNGTTYKFDTNVLGTALYNFNDNTSASNLGTFYNAVVNNVADKYKAAFSFKALDTDGDGKINTVVVYPFTVHKVTYVGTKTATTTAAAALGGAAGQISLEDDVYYDGIAKNDWVKKTAAANTVSGADTYEKIMPMTGKVTKETPTAGTVKSMINGIYFVNLAPVNGGNMQVASTYENIIQVNTFAFYAELAATSTTGEDYAVCIKATPADAFGAYKAKLLFSDGNIKEVETDVDYYTASTYSIANDTLVDFTVNAVNGKYTLATATNVPGGYTAAVTSPSYAVNADHVGYIVDGSSVKYIIDDNAIVFVKVTGTNAGYKMMTGAQLKTLGAVTTVNKAFYNVNQTTGFRTVALAFVTIADTATSSATSYGYMTAAPATTKDDENTTVYEVTYWDGAKEVTAIASSINDGMGYKGAIFQYTTDAKGRMVITAVPDLTLAQVTGFDGTAIQFDTAGANAAKISSNTTVFYINSKDVKGVEGGEIRTSDGTNANVYYVDANVAGGAAEFVVFDINNKMETLAAVTISAVNADTDDEINDAFDQYDTVIVSGTFAPTETVNIPAGKTLKATTATLTNNVTGAGTLAVGSFTNNETSAAFVQCANVQFVEATTAAVINAAIAGSNTVTVTGALPATGITIPAGKTLVVSAAQTVAKLQAITAADTAKLTLGAASTGNYTSAASKFYSTKGSAETAADKDDAVAAKELLTTEKIPAGIYTYGTLGYEAGDHGTPTLAGWFKG